MILSLVEMDWIEDEFQGDQMILEKNRPIFWKVAKTAAKTNNAQIQNTFLNSLFTWKCDKL